METMLIVGVLVIKGGYLNMWLHLLHYDSPGMRVWVYRNWWQRLFLDEHCATLAETIKFSGVVYHA